MMECTYNRLTVPVHELTTRIVLYATTQVIKLTWLLRECALSSSLNLSVAVCMRLNQIRNQHHNIVIHVIYAHPIHIQLTVQLED